MTKAGKQDAAERIREFVLEKFPLAKKRNLTIQDNLLDSGIIDSLGVLDLVGFLEEEFELQLADDELLPENFQSVAHIANLVNAKHLPSSASGATSTNRL
ncbi:MAG TPA: acyl carrier protein [Terriglobales bacterium]|jgi:acyl carrier protein|nr:acyl carrier protein [Terriglobales bacterium]